MVVVVVVQVPPSEMFPVLSCPVTSARERELELELLECGEMRAQGWYIRCLLGHNCKTSKH